jgi:polyferredoxin
MKRLRRIAIIAMCLSAFSIFVISNTVLAKPSNLMGTGVNIAVTFVLWTLLVIAIVMFLSLQKKMPRSYCSAR